MTSPIAVKSQDSAGGTQLAGGQSFFKVAGDIVVVLHDPVAGHGLFPHAAPIMAEASNWFRLNGIATCRAGHKASCGHPSTGRPFFRIS